MTPDEKTLNRKPVYTVIRLAYDATLERACELAKINPSDVALVQKVGERAPADLPDDFRIVSFDGMQMTISERIDGERRARGFAVNEETTTKFANVQARPGDR